MTRLLFALFITLWLIACTKSVAGHACLYPHCPYKGMSGVIKYEYSIDSLHILYPADSYDELLIKENLQQ